MLRNSRTNIDKCWPSSYVVKCCCLNMNRIADTVTDKQPAT